MSRHEISEPQRRDWRMLTGAGAGRGIAGCLAQAGSQSFRKRLRRADVHAHGMCYLWVPQLYFLHVSSDLLIGLSYIAISSTLIYLIYPFLVPKVLMLIKAVKLSEERRVQLERVGGSR
jgi:hypothetical protein